MKNLLFKIFAPANGYSQYKIWAAFVLVFQASATLIPGMLVQNDLLFEKQVALFSIYGLSLFSLLITKTSIQKWIAYSLALFGLSLCLVLLSASLTNSGILLYLLGWSMVVSLGYGREYFELKTFFIFMFVVLIVFAFCLYFMPSYESSSFEKITAIISGVIVIGLNIFLWSKETNMKSNHYSERRKRYEDIATLSIEVSEILNQHRESATALTHLTQLCQEYLHLEKCCVFISEGNQIYNLKRELVFSPDDNNIIALTIRKQAYQMLSNRNQSALDPIFNTFPIKGELSIPISHQNKVIAVLYVGSSLGNYFRDRHIQSLQVIATFVGIKLMQGKAEDAIRTSERNKAEMHRFKELDELKNKFISNVSHDLKTPLSLIKGPAQQIQKQTKEPNIEQLAGYIVNNTNHLQKIVQQLLELNSIEKGFNELSVETLNIATIFEKIQHLYFQGATEKNISLEFECDSFTFYSDQFRIEQIIHNLISNALRHTPSGGKIQISAHKSSEHFNIIISDTGIGIAPDQQEKVFERFYKVDENNQEGTGIGLALVKEYCELLEGQIQLESILNKGTQFTLQFPLRHSSSVPIKHHKINDQSSTPNKLKLMIVEDHEDLNNYIKQIFESKYEIIQCYNGLEGINHLENEIPDLIITDLMMPIQDGKTLVQNIRQNDEWMHIPIIVLSAKSQKESRIELYTLGVDNFINKPFEVEELEIIVDNTFKQRKQLRDHFRQAYLTTSDTDELKEALKPSEEAIKPSIIHQLQVFIQNELDNADLSVKDLSDHLAYGRNRLQKEIKELTGLTPVEFLRSTRLHEAKKLLSTSELSISEVAYAVGFNNLSYFTRSYKMEFDQLPTETISAKP